MEMSERSAAAVRTDDQAKEEKVCILAASGTLLCGAISHVLYWHANKKRLSMLFHRCISVSAMTAT
jgi:hypothetical protein